MLANLLAVDSVRADAERITTLVDQAGVRMERIVSWGQASPPGFWYDQDQAEWVTVLVGAALLRFEGEAQARSLRPGDHVLIAAHQRHRVEATDPDGPTIWLAVFFSEPTADPVR
ncbi:MAG: cupin domain-containing protein [Azospirillaceae bacterium]|nr:cupin domain-containing protein [Azospirillaceae bacterium]